jgi:triacylglycerol lipase
MGNWEVATTPPPSPDVPALLRALQAAEDAYTAMTSGELPAGYTALIRADRTLAPTTLLATKVLQDVEIFGVAGPGILALRGTFTLEEWLEDVEAVLVPSLIPDMGQWHAGFRELYLSIRASVIEAAFHTAGPLRIVGHSLGAALACYAAADVAQHGFHASVEGVTFGGPRCGDATWASAFNHLVPACLRVVNLGDLVPHVPLPPLFRHVGQDLPVQGGFHLNDVTFAHHLVTYQVGLQRLTAGTGTVP